MSDEKALLAAIWDEPHEDTPRLAYADWLDEHAGWDVGRCEREAERTSRRDCNHVAQTGWDRGFAEMITSPRYNRSIASDGETELFVSGDGYDISQARGHDWHSGAVRTPSDDRSVAFKRQRLSDAADNR